MVRHDVVLRGAYLRGAGGPAPTLLERTDQEFLPAILEQLASLEGRRALAGPVARRSAGAPPLQLFQPVHRTFYVVLLEAACNRLGQPRLDPRRVDSAGLVIRRLKETARRPGDPLDEGWMASGNALRGWRPFATPGDGNLDPDADRRPPALAAGHPEIDRRLALLGAGGETYAESFSPLFVAPPEVCRAAGRTYLYGLVPLASSERCETPAAPPAPGDEQVRELLPELLKSGMSEGNAADLRAGLVVALEQLHEHFDAFDGPESRGLLEVLNRIELPYKDGGPRPAGEVLARAAEVSLFGSGDLPDDQLPESWPAPDPGVERLVIERARTALASRFASLTAAEGRFDPVGREYRLRAFVRVKRDDGCPPDLVWSAPSDRFTIAPWYETSSVPPVQVALPDAENRGLLRALKPNVAFVLPESLLSLVEGSSLQGLLEREARRGGGARPGAICGFNIPIITLCAFIVLFLFLKLLNFVFRWLPLVKTCIPFPRRS
ncbi:MAG: hypothetical protein GY719_38025 [bacterium]|nr:hypothetical protein [bacterium]